MHRSCGRWPGSARAAGDPTIGAFLDLDAKSLQQTVGRRRDLRDRPVERLRVAGRWLLVAADLADVLAGGGLQFARCRRLVGATECLDASAHARRVHTSRQVRHSRDDVQFARGLQPGTRDSILGSRMAQTYDSLMTQTAPRQTRSAKLHEALAALKRAAKERHVLEEGTPEHARAIELEETLTRN